jgi:hypothetical protein
MTTKITLSNITDDVARDLAQVRTLATVSANLIAIGQANAATGGGGGGVRDSYGPGPYGRAGNGGSGVVVIRYLASGVI